MPAAPRRANCVRRTAPAAGRGSCSAARAPANALPRSRTPARTPGEARVGYAAGHDGVEVGEIRRHIDRDAVQRHPALEPHADGGDLVFKVLTFVRPSHPD